jgi:hypothetical protein
MRVIASLLKRMAVGVACLAALVFGACPPAHPAARGEGAGGRGAERDAKALEGEWVGISYDFNGKMRLPLKSSEILKLRFVRDAYAPRWLHAIYQKPALQDVDREEKQNDSMSGEGVFEIQPKGKPGTGILDLPDRYAGIAYSVEGADMTARFFWKRAKRDVDFTAKEGSPNIVFHLKRVEKTTPGARKELPQPPAGDSANGKAAIREEAVPGSTPAIQERDDARPGGRGASTPRLDNVLGSWVGVSYEYSGQPTRDFKRGCEASLLLTERGYDFTLRIPAATSKRSDFDLQGGGRFVFDLTKDPMELRCNTDPPKVVAVFRMKGDDMLWSFVEEGVPPRLKTDKGDMCSVVLFRKGRQKTSKPIP